MKKNSGIINNVWICGIEGNSVKPVFGDMVYRDGMIVDIIKKDFLAYIRSTEKYNGIDGGGAVVTPPLVNFHDHFYSRLGKGLAIKGSMKTFPDKLKNLWWKLDALLTADMIKASAELAVNEALKSGVTYIFDHHASYGHIEGSLETIASVMEKRKVRGVLCFETSDRNGKAARDKALKENASFAAEKTGENIKALFGLHASFTLSDESLQKTADSLMPGQGIHIHLCEDKADRSVSKEKYGALPVKRLMKYSLLHDKSILVHAVHITKSEADAIARSGAAIALNIDSNLNNAVGTAPFSIHTDDTPLLCGTDGMHGNPGRTMKNIFLLARHSGYSMDDAFSLINRIYLNQYQFVKKYYPDFTTLKKGSRADFVVWDYVPPAPLTAKNFFGHYLYGLLEREPIYVAQKGEFLLKKKQLTGIDELALNKLIYDQGEKLAKAFARSKGKKYD